MSKFKVGDKVRATVNNLYMTGISKTDILTISHIAKDGWCSFEEIGYHFAPKFLVLAQSPKNRVIDQMNEERQGVAMTTETPVCYHDWHDILLFTSTVTECKKCGITKEKHYGK